MAKNLIAVFNSNNKLWVIIFKLKYGDFYVWNCVKLTKSSGSYKSLSKISNVHKLNF